MPTEHLRRLLPLILMLEYRFITYVNEVNEQTRRTILRRRRASHERQLWEARDVQQEYELFLCLTQRRQRRWWVAPRLGGMWVGALLNGDTLPDDLFEKHFRLSRPSFQILHSLLRIFFKSIKANYRIVYRTSRHAIQARSSFRDSTPHLPLLCHKRCQLPYSNDYVRYGSIYNLQYCKRHCIKDHLAYDERVYSTPNSTASDTYHELVQKHMWLARDSWSYRWYTYPCQETKSSWRNIFQSQISIQFECSTYLLIV